MPNLLKTLTIKDFNLKRGKGVKVQERIILFKNSKLKNLLQKFTLFTPFRPKHNCSEAFKSCKGMSFYTAFTLLNDEEMACLNF